MIWCPHQRAIKPMSNHIADILESWFPHCESSRWVLGVVYRTHGPCYRKAGAMMLLSDSGIRLGLLSGGCLEADIQLHARKAMQTNRAILLSYDGSDEDDISFQLGIGCGGIVEIALLPLLPDNNFMQLKDAREALALRRKGILTIPITSYADELNAQFRVIENSDVTTLARFYQNANGADYLDIVVQRSPHVLIAGGGIDAIPVVSIAKSLGWEVSVWDSRPANARPEHFSQADQILTGDVSGLKRLVAEHGVTAVILMTHNVTLDAMALASLKSEPLTYLALLGPASRRAEVLEEAGLVETDIKTPISGPAGLQIGGELPESIALSILAECHTRFYLSN